MASVLHRFCAAVLALSLVACGGGSSGTPTPTTPDPATLPLLADGQHVGIIYSGAVPAATATLDAAFAECISRGVSTYELAVAWSDIEVSPGVIDTSYLEGLLTTIEAAGLTPYLGLTTIDTVVLTLPTDLVDPTDSGEFAAGGDGNPKLTHPSRSSPSLVMSTSMSEEGDSSSAEALHHGQNGGSCPARRFGEVIRDLPDGGGLMLQHVAHQFDFAWARLLLTGQGSYLES